MQLCTFQVDTPVGRQQRIGVFLDSSIVDVTAASVAHLEARYSPEGATRIGHARVPPDMITLLGTGGDARDWVRECVDAASARGQTRTASGETILYGSEQVRLLSPIPRPTGIACFITWPAHIEDSRDKGFAMLSFPPRDGNLGVLQGQC